MEKRKSLLVAMLVLSGALLAGCSDEEADQEETAITEEAEPVEEEAAVTEEAEPVEEAPVASGADESTGELGMSDDQASDDMQDGQAQGGSPDATNGDMPDDQSVPQEGGQDNTQEGQPQDEEQQSSQ